MCSAAQNKIICQKAYNFNAYLNELLEKKKKKRNSDRLKCFLLIDKLSDRTYFTNRNCINTRKMRNFIQV